MPPAVSTSHDRHLTLTPFHMAATSHLPSAKTAWLMALDALHRLPCGASRINLWRDDMQTSPRLQGGVVDGSNATYGIEYTMMLPSWQGAMFGTRTAQGHYSKCVVSGRHSIQAPSEKRAQVR